MFTLALDLESSSPDYVIRPLRGEFRLPVIEQAYRTYSLRRTRTSLRIGFCLCAALYMLCWLADVRAAGVTLPAFHGLIGRATFAVSALTLLQLLRRWPDSVRAPVLIACFGDLIGSVVFMALVLCIPAEIPTLEVAALLVVLAMYMLVPNRLVYSIFFATIYSITFLLITYGAAGHTVDLFTEALYLVAANIASWVIALRHNILLRADFRSKMRLREQASRDHLHMVLLEDEIRALRAAYKTQPSDDSDRLPDVGYRLATTFTSTRCARTNSD